MFPITPRYPHLGVNRKKGLISLLEPPRGFWPRRPLEGGECLIAPLLPGSGERDRRRSEKNGKRKKRRKESRLQSRAEKRAFAAAFQSSPV